ncbi:MAG TPA: butyryl-CoA dehydrogenase, partial [Armatimonadetes bacterium]|nr:butyryl-CoA dehydrogenase [Armatimonadota bacterium]
MEFALTAEHEQIREAAYKFGQNVIVPSVGELDRQHTSDPETLKKLGEAGLLGLGIPAKWGGTDTDYISVGIACEELERADSTARVVMSVHVGLHCMTMMQWGTEEQCAKWLPDLATGKKIGAFGLTEPNAGSDAASMKTTARREGDEYVLNGEKTWISLADYADQFLVIARLAETDAKAPYAAFIVERDRPGFSSRAIKGKLGVRAGNTGQIFFDNVR